MHPAHQQFIDNYGITDVATFTRLYELEELILFLPPNPSPEEKTALQQLVGTLGEGHGYMDYVKSNNTFELIMQWREKTGNF
jgi:hypothetical protein